MTETNLQVEQASLALLDFAEKEGRSVRCETFAGPVFHAATREDHIRPAASLMKIPLVFAVEQASSRGEFALATPVSVADLPATAYPNILAAFDRGRTLSLQELCRLALITSDNGAASYLWDLVGTAAVNEALEQLGCKDSCAACSFLDEELGDRGRVNLTTASDMIEMFRSVERLGDGSVLKEALANNLRNQRMPLFLEDEVKVAHKTGSLDGVINDAGIVYTGSVSVAFAFLTDGQEDPEMTAYEIGRCVKNVIDALGLDALTR